MYKYAVALKPVVVAGGVEGLDESKRLMFDSLLNVLAQFFKSTPEIDDVEIREDFTMVIHANKDVWDTISGKLGKSAIVSKL